MKDELTREEAVAIVGMDAVNAVEKENCEPTNLVGYNGECQGDDWTEWESAVACKDKEGADVILSAYYYTDNEEDRIIGETSDGSNIEWPVSHYTVG